MSRFNLSNRTLLVLFCAGCLLLAVGFWLSVYRPTRSQMQKLHMQTDITLRSMGTLAEVQQRHTAAISAHTQALEKAVAVFSQLPREDDLPTIMNVVDAVARRQGAQTAMVDYSQVQWEQNLGRIQITALFSGSFAPLASTIVNLTRVLPSSRLEQVRITSHAKAEATPAAASTLPETATRSRITPVVDLLRDALGLTSRVPEDSSALPDAYSSPLDVDHLEAYVVLTLYLVKNAVESGSRGDRKATSELVSLTQLLGGRGQWYARPAERFNPGDHDPFLPSARASELVRLNQLVEQYSDIRVAGIAQSGARYVAIVEWQGRNIKVNVGDTLGEAKVEKIDSQVVTLSIAGHNIPITLGGGKK